MKTIRKDIESASTIDEFKTNVVDKLKVKLQVWFLVFVTILLFLKKETHLKRKIIWRTLW